MRKLILVTVLLSGCVTEGHMQRTTADLNAAHAKNFHPLRYEHSRVGEVDRVTTVLAGVVGETVANDAYRQGILEYIEASCGFKADALKEIRIVKHQPPLWYEVWVFDPPPRQERSLGHGISVVMRYRAEIDKTDISFRWPGQACSKPELGKDAVEYPTLRSLRVPSTEL